MFSFRAIRTKSDQRFFEGSESENSQINSEVSQVFSEASDEIFQKKGMCQRFQLYFFGRRPAEGTPPCYQETRYRYYPNKA